MSGMVSNIKDQMGGVLDTILSLPDRPKHPAAQKAARIAYDLLIIGLGLVVFSMMTKWNLSTLADPSMTTMMAMPLALALGGVGFSWLLEDMMSKKHRRCAGKIMSIIMPIVLAAGAACLIAAGFRHGLTPVSMSNYWFAGLLIFPLSFFALDRAIERVGFRREAYFEKTPFSSVSTEESAARRERLEETRRIETSRRHRIDEDSEAIELRDMH